MTIKAYTPELGQEQPQPVTGNIRRAISGKHIFIDTPEDIPTSRSVVLLGTHDDHRRKGWNHYKVTIAAMEKLAQQFDFSERVYLD